MPSELFPDTQGTRLQRWVRAGDLSSVLAHVMTVYRDPLLVYAAKSSARRVGDPDDLVQGFLTDRLARPGYVEAWLDQRGGGAAERERPLRLRQWLVNGFWLYVKELLQEERRHHHVGEVPDLPAEGDGPEDEFDRARAHTLVREAMREAERDCAASGLTEHWTVLVQHVCHGVPYEDLPRELGLSPERAAVMCRTAKRRFERAFNDLLRAELATPEDLAQERDVLLEVIEP